MTTADFTDFKSALASKAVWGGIIAVVAGIVGLWGYSVSPADQASIVDAVSSIAAGVGGAIAIIGRILATKKIGAAPAAK